MRVVLSFIKIGLVLSFYFPLKLMGQFYKTRKLLFNTSHFLIMRKTPEHSKK